MTIVWVVFYMLNRFNVLFNWVIGYLIKSYVAGVSHARVGGEIGTLLHVAEIVP